MHFYSRTDVTNLVQQIIDVCAVDSSLHYCYIAWHVIWYCQVTFTRHEEAACFVLRWINRCLWRDVENVATHYDVDADVMLSSDSLCSSPSQVLPSALVLTTSDGGEGGHDAAPVCSGGFAGNTSRVTAESLGPSSSLSAAISSSTMSEKLALDRMTSSVSLIGQGVVVTSHIASSSIIGILSLASELPLHGRSASDRLRTSETSPTPNQTLISLICNESPNLTLVLYNVFISGTIMCAHVLTHYNAIALHSQSTMHGVRQHSVRDDRESNRPPLLPYRHIFSSFC